MDSGSLLSNFYHTRESLHSLCSFSLIWCRISWGYRVNFSTSSGPVPLLLFYSLLIVAETVFFFFVCCRSVLFRRPFYPSPFRRWVVRVSHFFAPPPPTGPPDERLFLSTAGVPIGCLWKLFLRWSPLGCAFSLFPTVSFHLPRPPFFPLTLWLGDHSFPPLFYLLDFLKPIDRRTFISPSFLLSASLWLIPPPPSLDIYNLPFAIPIFTIWPHFV